MKITQQFSPLIILVFSSATREAARSNVCDPLSPKWFGQPCSARAQMVQKSLDAGSNMLNIGWLVRHSVCVCVSNRPSIRLCFSEIDDAGQKM